MFKKNAICCASILLGCSINIANSVETTEGYFMQIAKPTGSIQCDLKQGVSRATMQRELTAQSINVSSALCGHYSVDAACGEPSGNLNIYEIQIFSEEQLKKIKKLGFQPLHDNVWLDFGIDTTCPNEEVQQMVSSDMVTAANRLDIIVNNKPKNAVKIRTLLANAITKNMLHTLVTEDKSGNFSVCVEANAQTTDAQFKVWANKLRSIQRLANSNVVITPRQTSCLLKK